jgi:large subunit ribosomal protein L4
MAETTNSTLKAAAFTAGGTERERVDLPADVFDGTINMPVMHQAVKAYLSNQRLGLAYTKTRGLVTGGNQKPWKQKGTGRARQGSTRAPQFTGGGVVHGPQPRSYDQRTPKKMKAAALRGALSDRARGGRVHVLSALVEGDAPSTKQALAALAAVSQRQSLLVVVAREDVLGWKSLRNLDRVHAIMADQLNTYDVLCSDDVVFTAAALEAFLAGPPKGKSAKAVATESEAQSEAQSGDMEAAK